MELTSEHIAFFHRGMDAGAVFCHRPDDLRLLRLKIIGMDKIYIRVLQDPPEQSSVILKVKRVPSHMRDLKSRRGRDLQDLPFQDTKAFHSRTFFTALKKKLKPQADPKKRPAVFYQFPDRGNQPEPVKVCHTVAEASHSRKDHFIRLCKDIRITGKDHFLPKMDQRFFHAFYIACVIINNTYHHYTSCLFSCKQVYPKK